MSDVTQADRERKKRIQQRFLTEGISHSQVLDEELANHRIEAEQALAERERVLVETVKGPLSWLERWATHQGNCAGESGVCTCGLELARWELRKALAKVEATNDTK